MKALEEYLLSDNLFEDENIEAVNAHIRNLLQQRRNVQAISLIMVWDRIENAEKEALRKNGFIFNLAQLKEDCNKYIEDGLKKPTKFRSQLKRLDRALESFIAGYAAGKIANAGVIEEVRQEFINLFGKSLVMDAARGLLAKDLTEEIATLRESAINDIFAQWIGSALAEDQSKEIDETVAQRIYKDWSFNQLSPEAVKILEEIKVANNNPQALLRQFADKTLSIEIQKRINEKVRIELIKQFTAGTITPISDLGQDIINRRNRSAANTLEAGVIGLMADWPNIDDKVAAQLNDIILNVIKEMDLPSDPQLDQQFSILAVKNFIQKLKVGEHGELLEGMFKHVKESAKIWLSLDSNTDNVALPLCRQSINKTVLGNLHDRWFNGNLSADTSKFLKDQLFVNMVQYQRAIHAQITIGAANERANQLQMENTHLRADLVNLQEKMEKMSRVINQFSAHMNLSSAQLPGVKSASTTVEGTKSSEQKESNAAIMAKRGTPFIQSDAVRSRVDTPANDGNTQSLDGGTQVDTSYGMK